jgi:hypothetical protein
MLTFADIPPTHLSICVGDKEIVRFIRQKGGGLDVRVSPDMGDTEAAVAFLGVVRDAFPEWFKSSTSPGEPIPTG